MFVKSLKSSINSCTVTITLLGQIVRLHWKPSCFSLLIHFFHKEMTLKKCCCQWMSLRTFQSSSHPVHERCINMITTLHLQKWCLLHFGDFSLRVSKCKKQSWLTVFFFFFLSSVLHKIFEMQFKLFVRHQIHLSLCVRTCNKTLIWFLWILLFPHTFCLFW